MSGVSFDSYLPCPPIPPEHTPESWLRELTTRGTNRRYGSSASVEITTRIERELEMITAARVASYMLIVAEYVDWATQEGIWVGPGRGTVAGSVVAYALGITEVDPLRHGLLFERFLNTEVSPRPRHRPSDLCRVGRNGFRKVRRPCWIAARGPSGCLNRPATPGNRTTLRGGGQLPEGRNMAKIDKLLEKAKPHLESNEDVLAAVQGQYETSILGTDSVRAGVLIATQNRIVFYAKKLGGYELESFVYGNISSFEQGKNMMGHNIKFFASGNKVAMKWISDLKDMEKFVSAVKQHMGANASSVADPAPVASTAPAADDRSGIIEAIKQLGELHSAGVLNDDEFANKKAELLAKL